MKQIIKNMTGGMAVGIANIIPGVSGGTMLVIMGLFDRLMDSISEVAKVKSEKRWEAIKFLIQVLIGAGIGLVAFAKIVDWLFINYSTQTFFWFIGLVLFSIPSLMKKEMKGHKLSWPWLGIGFVIIFVISFFTPEKQALTVTEFPSISIVYVLTLMIVGIVAGATMLFPGVSGSMILLIIGQYYLFKSLVANVTSFEWNVLISLGFIGIGAVIGILLSAKLTTYLLKKSRGQTVSLIVGLIIASAIVLIPFDATYTVGIAITSFVALIVGGLVVLAIDRVV